jgi:predicted RNase H-like nuclease (RuvC/YqgF family)
MTRRYISEEQITKAIDKALAHAKAIEHEVVVLEDEIRKLRDDPSDQDASWKIEQLRDLQLQLSRRANRILTTRIKHLSDKLAEFRTRLLPFEGNGDSSIPVRVSR